MNIRTPLLVSLLLVAAMAGLSVWAWPQIPDGARIATHFGMDGQPNGYSDKTYALALAPGMALILTVALALIPRIEPRRLNLMASAKFYRAGWIVATGILATMHAMIVLGALHIGQSHLSERPQLFILPLLFVVLGNYMGKTRSNFFAGIRTPWTLSSEYSWEKTHRFCGRLFVIVGILSLLGAFVLDVKTANLVLFGGVAGIALVSIIASYFFWLRDPARHTSDGVPE